MAGLPLIAIVDDDASARAAMVALVEAMGFGARAFAIGADLLASGALRTAFAVIADHRMPGMGGLELCLEAKARSAALRTILITAYPDQTTERHARRSGIDGYLAKPCDPEALLACLGIGPADLPAGDARRRHPIPGQELPDTSG
ncbi:response regulator [Bosea sp. ANAM02]|uniref:response regulator transcription factor n=1 Tax=Bosea sp. ANAM02 TaxID=2020412 RepID=UPI00140E999B|nr:response regulator [Bosea sp. ANAM02]BCB20048.1 response regulator [Bosea sp. ANAM02]